MSRSVPSAGTTSNAAMADAPEKKTVLIVGGGAVGAIAALNLEVGGLAEVTLVLRSNYDAVSKDGFDIKSCDHGHVRNWRPSIGEWGFFRGRCYPVV